MKKLTTRQFEIFEKVVRQNGHLFLVRFVILERAGKLRGKVLSCTPIEVLAGSAEPSTSYLPVFRHTQAAPTETRTFEEILSPFTTLEFFVSQMTRAPSPFAY